MMLKTVKNIDRTDLLSAFSLFITVMVLQSILANIWAGKGLFDQYEIIFDSDPNEWLLAFSTGYGFGSLMHPLSNYLVTVPLRIIENIFSIFGLVDDSEAFKMELALYVAPFFTALKAVCFFIIFRMLNINRFQAILATLITAMAFSSVVFGATPESYPITGFALTLLTLFSLCIVRYDTRLVKIGFYLASIFAIGTTLSNVIYVGWSKWFIYIRKGLSPISSLTRSIILSGTLLIFTIVVSIALLRIVSELRGEEIVEPETGMVEFLSMFVPSLEDQIEKAYRFPEMMTRTIIPTVPGHNPDSLVFEYDMPIKIEFSYIKQKFDLFSMLYSFLAIGCIGGGAFIAYKKGGAWKTLALSSSAAIITYWLFFSWFGLSVFLYSQYWCIPSILMLSAWLTTSTFRSSKGLIILFAIAALMLIANILVLKNITAQFV